MAKILSALRRLGDGVPFSSLDDQARMSAESMRQTFHLFIQAVHKCYAREFLNRAPSVAELRDIERAYASRLFPGCVGALHCMHMHRKNCRKSWKGQCHNPKAGKRATIQVEAMCDSDLYWWHVYVGHPGTNNSSQYVKQAHLAHSICEVI